MDKKNLLIIILFFTVLAHMFRYDITAVNNFGYLLDRWTGEIRVIVSNKIMNMKEE